MNIQPLNESVREQLQSAQLITSAAECVCELVMNSIDAKATNIAVIVNLPQFRIQVVDNGIGISSAVLSAIGTRYVTTKKSSKLYGYRGEALCSIIHVSSGLKITTRERTDGSPTVTQYICVDQKTEILQCDDRSSCGTTVTIAGFMARYPVRQKHLREIDELDTIRRLLEPYTLIQPRIVFSLRDSATNRLVFQTTRRTSILAALKELHDNIDTEGFQKISMKIRHEGSYVRLQGLFHLHYGKLVQYFYVNQRPVRCPELEIYFTRNFRQYAGTTSKSPAYMIHVSCPSTHIDLLRHPNGFQVHFKHLNSMMECMDRFIRRLLTSQCSMNDHRKSKRFKFGARLQVKPRGLSLVSGLIKGVATRPVEEPFVEENDQVVVAQERNDSLPATSNAIDPDDLVNQENVGKQYILKRFMSDLHPDSGFFDSPGRILRSNKKSIAIQTDSYMHGCCEHNINVHSGHKDHAPVANNEFDDFLFAANDKDNTTNCLVENGIQSTPSWQQNTHNNSIDREIPYFPSHHQNEFGSFGLDDKNIQDNLCENECTLLGYETKIEDGNQTLDNYSSVDNIFHNSTTDKENNCSQAVNVGTEYGERGLQNVYTKEPSIDGIFVAPERNDVEQQHQLENDSMNFDFGTSPKRGEEPTPWSERFNFIPRGMSPIMQNVGHLRRASPTTRKELHCALKQTFTDDLNYVKWSNYDMTDNSCRSETVFPTSLSEACREVDCSRHAECPKKSTKERRCYAVCCHCYHQQ